MHAGFEATQHARREHNAKAYRRLNGDAREQRAPISLAMRPGKRRREAQAVEGGKQDERREQYGLGSSTAP
jgi:hypothetical protein